MNRQSIYQHLQEACRKGEAYIDIGCELDQVRRRVRDLSAENENDRGRLRQRLMARLISDYGLHQQLEDLLMLTAQTHGWWHYWDIDGRLLSTDKQPERVAYRITKSEAFWFRELCGYQHLPVLPLNWLRQRLAPGAVAYLSRVLDLELDQGGELWSYAMPAERTGPLCYEAGIAVVRDGVPVRKIPTITA